MAMATGPGSSRTCRSRSGSLPRSSMIRLRKAGWADAAEPASNRPSATNSARQGIGNLIRDGVETVSAAMAVAAGRPSQSAGDVQSLEQIQRLAELVVVVLRARRGRGLAAGAIRAAVAVAQVAGQVGLLDPGHLVLAGQAGAAHLDVRHDALGLDGAAVGGVVERGGQLQGAILVERQDGLYRALAEAVGTHDHGAPAVLQGAGDDLRGRGAAAVDQYHQRHALAGVGRIGVEA